MRNKIYQFTEKIKTSFRQKEIAAWTLLLLISAMAFLPLVFELGLYRQDDWQVMWAGQNRGLQQVIDFQKVDRPLQGYSWAAAYAVLGNHPLHWHLYAYFLRLASGIIFLSLLRMFWKKNTVETTLAALVFLIYPGYLQQPDAATYHNHLLSLDLGLLSLLSFFTAQRVEKTRYKWILMAFSMLTAGVSFMIMEWMIGIEGIRLAFIGLSLFRQKESKGWKQLRSLISQWLPNGLILLLFIIWRVFIFRSARQSTDIAAMLTLYRFSPLQAGLRLVLEYVFDLIDVTILAWFVPLYQSVMNSSYIDWLISLVIATAGVGACAFYFSKSHQVAKNPIKNLSEVPAGEEHWAKEMLLIGIFSALTCLAPFALSNRFVQYSDQLDRFSITASLGVAMVLTAGLSLLFSGARRWKTALFFIGISLVTHYNNSAIFRDQWSVYRDFWWQLAWRAPALKDGTVLLPLLPPGYRIADSFEIVSVANLIYYPREYEVRISGEAPSEQTLSSILQGGSYGHTYRGVSYVIDFKQSLVASMPVAHGCVHVYDGSNLETPASENSLGRLLANVSSTDLIKVEAEPILPPANIFGEEPFHGWCYYYQKASLARQRMDWEEVIRLGEEARSLGYSPSDVSEWMPFYQAYALTGRIEEATQIGSILREHPDFQILYCAQFENKVLNFVSESEEFALLNICPQIGQK